MGARSSEKILREFVRLAQDRSIILESGGGPTPQLINAIKLIQDQKPDIQYCLDYYENPVQVFTGDYPDKLENLVRSAIALDKGNQSPLALILLASCFSNKTDFTNVVAALGDIRTLISKTFVREGTIRTTPIPSPGAPAPVRGSDFGWRFTGDIMAGFRARGLSNDVADDMATIIDSMVGGATGAKALVQAGKMPDTGKAYVSITGGRLVQAPTDVPFNDAVTISMIRLHELNGLKRAASPELLAEMNSLGLDRFTCYNLNQLKNRTSDPAIRSEAETLHTRSLAEIRAAVTPQNTAAIIRAVALQETMIVKGVKTRLRPAVGATPAALIVGAGTAALTASLLGIIDLKSGDPSIPSAEIAVMTAEAITASREVLNNLAEAFYRLGKYEIHGAIAGLVSNVISGTTNVDPSLDAILTALARE